MPAARHSAPPDPHFRLHGLLPSQTVRPDTLQVNELFCQLGVVIVCQRSLPGHKFRAGAKAD